MSKHSCHIMETESNAGLFERTAADPAAGEALTSSLSSTRTCFILYLTGRVESGSFPFIREGLYCRYSYYYGSDWEILHGVNSGVTQISQNVGVDQGAVWNFPIEVTFQSFGVYGWPRLVFSVYGLDSLGRDTVKGYGSALCPTTAGMHELCVSMFAPSESSLLRRFTTWITGSRPEFYHSTFVAQGKGRALTLVRSSGYVNVILNVVVKGIEP